MNKRFLVILVVAFVLAAAGVFTSIAYANHSWGGYHWARTSNPFTLKLGDNVSSGWDAHLVEASSDWSLSDMLDTAVVPGSTKPQSCKPKNGQVEVCSSKYGKTGWLGIAQIWVSGSHITQAITKMNDTYFNTSFYNTPAWKQFVVCQEIGHTFGLDHQDVDFNNTNMGTCMDYTNDPARNDGFGDNLRPNIHDYDELGIIYQHLTDGFTTLLAKISPAAAADIDTSNPSEWGKVIRKSGDGRSSLHERDLGKGRKLFTFVIWAD